MGASGETSSKGQAASYETQTVPTGRKSAKKKLRLRLLCGCIEVRAISVTR